LNGVVVIGDSGVEGAAASCSSTSLRPRCNWRKFSQTRHLAARKQPRLFSSTVRRLNHCVALCRLLNHEYWSHPVSEAGIECRL
jgi:hypothetical protein